MGIESGEAFVTRKVAKAASERVMREAIEDLRAAESGPSGDDSGLENSKQSGYGIHGKATGV